MKEMKDGKAAGADGIPIELLKCLQDNGIKEITHLCNKIYRCGEWPSDFLCSEMVALPKKQGTKKCQEHRTILVPSLPYSQDIIKNNKQKAK